MGELGIGAEEVASKEFPVAFRGFAQHDVRAFLAQVAAELAAARERERFQRERLEAAEARAATHKLTDEEVEEALGHEAGRVLQAAREAASEIRARAEEQVGRLVREASGEGTRAQQEAESLLARRSEEAEKVGAEIRAEAQARAEAEIEQAKAEGREMVAEAQAVRERVLKDLARRRRLAHQQLEQLRAGRERLLEAYRVVRSTLDEATRELSVAEVEARAAAEMASLRVGGQAEATVDELEAELTAARDLGLALASPSPAGRSSRSSMTSANGGTPASAPDGRPPSFPPPSRPEAEGDQGAGADQADQRDQPLDALSASGMGAAAGAPAGAPFFSATLDDVVPVAPVEEAEPDVAVVPGGLPGPPLPNEAGPDLAVAPVEPPDPALLEEAASYLALLEEKLLEETVSDLALPEETLPEETLPEVTLPEETLPEERLPEETLLEETPPEETLPEERLPEETLPEETLPEERLPEEGLLEAGMSNEAVSDLREADHATPEAPAYVPRVDLARADLVTGAVGDPAGAVAGDLVETDPPAPEGPAWDAGLTVVPPPATPSEPTGTAPSPAQSEGTRPGAGPGPGGVEELFARLRAERALTVSKAEAVLAGSPAPDGSGAHVDGGDGGDGGDSVDDGGGSMAADAVPPVDDEAVLQGRDADIELVERVLVRALKRSLADEQNEVLDTLRRHRGPAALTDLLPGRNEHVGRYLAVAAPDLRAAAAQAMRSAASTSAHPRGRDSSFAEAQFPETPPTDDLAAGVADEVVDDLRARLERALEGADGDHALLVEGISAAYREWRTSRVEPLARHHVAAAHTRGRFSAAPEGPLRWVVDGEEGPCPDCDDNALAGATMKGQPFPTGQQHPPAHLGCRCTIAVGPG